MSATTTQRDDRMEPEIEPFFKIIACSLLVWIKYKTYVFSVLPLTKYEGKWKRIKMAMK